jgi:hypothetical protein
MPSNPYAPPQAVVADIEPETHGLKHRSVWLVVVFLLVSLGTYSVVWFFRRRPGLNRLDSDRKLPLWPLLVLTALYLGQFGLGLVSGGEPLPQVIGQTAFDVLRVAQFVIGLGMAFYCFRIKFIIEDHASSQDSDVRSFQRVELSGIMTLFFSIAYLQWAINRYVVKV